VTSARVDQRESARSLAPRSSANAPPIRTSSVSVQAVSGRPIASASPGCGPNGSPVVRDQIQSATIGTLTTIAAMGPSRVPV
jgi:hypothetical protein